MTSGLRTPTTPRRQVDPAPCPPQRKGRGALARAARPLRSRLGAGGARAWGASYIVSQDKSRTERFGTFHCRKSQSRSKTGYHLELLRWAFSPWAWPTLFRRRPCNRTSGSRDLEGKPPKSPKQRGRPETFRASTAPIETQENGQNPPKSTSRGDESDGRRRKEVGQKRPSKETSCTYRD